MKILLFAETEKAEEHCAKWCKPGQKDKSSSLISHICNCREFNFIDGENRRAVTKKSLRGKWGVYGAC